MAEALPSVSLTQLSEDFENAAEHVATSLATKLTPDKLLPLYGYYKQAVAGPCQTPRPNWYQMQAKQKWEAWKALGEMPVATAMKKYIEIVGELDPGWEECEFDEDEDEDDVSSPTTTNKSGLGWVAVSCMPKTDSFIADEDKTLFDWVKEGNVERVKEACKKPLVRRTINDQDEEGLGLVHWAADRGDTDMLHHLVGDMNADVNLKDSEGQTPLHYAASCGHKDIVRLLLKFRADPTIPDSDGSLPFDVASSSEVKEVFGTSFQVTD
uniref:Acyl-CoA-binding domain-containing protein 6 n=1 Tax=Timema monikensis TaxID=170555 RepID=A0A7R9EFB5_9NEOP|nr:unnamed protein product [Timema monikensis]